MMSWYYPDPWMLYVNGNVWPTPMPSVEGPRPHSNGFFTNAKFFQKHPCAEYRFQLVVR